MTSKIRLYDFFGKFGIAIFDNNWYKHLSHPPISDSNFVPSLYTFKKITYTNVVQAKNRNFALLEINSYLEEIK